METVGIVGIEDKPKTQKKEFKPVIFVSEYTGLGLMEEDGNFILNEFNKPVRFTPFSISHPKYGDISKGHYLCKNKETYDKLVNHPGFKKAGAGSGSYKIVKRLPFRTNDAGMIVQGVSTADGGINKASLGDEQRNMLRELGSLEAKYFTEESGHKTFKANIREDSRDGVSKRIEYIKSELDIND